MALAPTTKVKELAKSTTLQHTKPFTLQHTHILYSILNPDP